MILINKKMGFWLLLLFLGSVGFSQNSGSDRLFTEGIARLKAKNYLLAETLLTQFLSGNEENPNYPQALLGLGVACLRNGDTQQSIDYLMTLSTKFATDPIAREGLYWRGIGRYLLGDFIFANEIFEEFLAFPLLPEDHEDFVKDQQQRWDSIVYRGWTLFRSGNKELAYEVLKEGFDRGLSIDYSFPLFTLTCSLALEREDYSFLEALFKAASFENFTSDEKYHLSMYWGEILLATQGTEAAFPHYEEVVEADPSWDNQVSRFCWKRIFKFLVEDGEFDPLSEMTARILSIGGFEDEEMRALLLRRVSLLEADEQWESVVELTQDYLESYPMDLRMWSFRVMALQQEEFQATVSILPPSVVKDILGASPGKGVVFGDYLWVQVLREQSKALEWKKCQSGARDFMKLYPESTFYWQALYLASYSAMQQGKLKEALTLLMENSGWQNVIKDLFYQKGGSETFSVIDKDFLRLVSLNGYLLEKNLQRREAFRYFRLLVDPYLNQSLELIVSSGEIDELFLERLYTTALVSFQEADYDYMNRVCELFFLINEDEDVQEAVLLQYFQALALISEKNYEEAFVILESIGGKFGDSNVLTPLRPWWFYYRGWSLYRTGNYVEAIEVFSNLQKKFPNHSLIHETKKLLAWSALSAGEYDLAAKSFLSYGESSQGEMESYAYFMAGRSFHLDKNFREGHKWLAPIVKNKKSAYADDALMELAMGALHGGQFQEASNYFLQMGELFPDSPLAEEAAFSAGESLFHGGFYEEAISLYSSYRRSWSKGYNYQAALFRGAAASIKIGDLSGALFLYLRLHEQFPKGPYGAETLIGLAEIFTEQEEWDSAMGWYRELQNRFPAEARLLLVSQRLNNLFFRAQGKDSREAELLLVIEDNGGVNRRKGRSAALQLASLYLNLYRSEENRLRALGWLNEIRLMSEDYPEDSSLANRLLGDDSFRMGNSHEAMIYYLDAATLATKTEEVGNLLFRAVQATQEIGAFSDSLLIIKTMEEKVPKSNWTTKAKILPGIPRLLEKQLVEESELGVDNER